MAHSRSARTGRARSRATDGATGPGPAGRRATPDRPGHEPLEVRRLMSVNVTTYHYDNARDGANTAETTLTTADVNSGSFGKVGSLAVDGQIYAQPLVMTGVAVAGQGTHDVVIAATEADDVYAFDAGGNNPAQGYLWRTSLLQSGETTIPESDYGTTDITPQIGITGTPVIDPATNTLYVVGAFKETATGAYQQRLYALDLSTGAAKFGGPALITASVAGTGVATSGGQVAFSAFRENQRPALTLANGEVYVGWSAHGDQDPFHGWVMAYNAATLKQDYVYNDTPNGDAGGIWMSGGGIAVDASGNLYFTTGNGTFDANTGGSDYGMALEKLSPSLGVEDYFTPYNEAPLSNDDLDFGCSSVVLLPTQSGADPDEVLSEGKWGTIYLNSSDTGHLGEFTANGPNDDLGQANITSDVTTSNVHNTMSYWDGHVYESGDALPVQSFAAGNGTLATSPSSVSAHVFGSTAVEDGQGAGPTVSSNGTANGIVWAVDNTGFTNAPAVLYAYNANDLTQVLYTSGQAANGRDTCGDAVKFQDAVVANGYVYVGGANAVTIYGLLSPSTATPTLVTAAAATPSPATGTTTTLSVAATDPAADLRPVYTWAATATPAGAAAPTFSVNGVNNANAPTVTFYRAGTYTFTVTVTDPNSQLTTTSTVTVTVAQTLAGVTVSPSAVTVPDTGSQQFAGSANDQFGNPLATQPAFAWAVRTGGAGGTVTPAGLYTAPATGTGTDTLTATTGSLSATATVTVAVPTAVVQVNLSNYFNLVGIEADGTAFTNGGIDADGDGLSGTLLGTSKTWGTTPFTIGAATAADDVDNVVQATGQTIPLAPQSSYASLKLLALHLNGSAAALTVTVTYTDGTTQAFTQGFSDWFSPQNYAGESKAVTMAYRDTSTGAKDKRTFYVYGYTFALNTAKAVKSVTLPADTGLNVLAVDLLGVAVTVPAAASPAVVTGATTALTVTGVDPTGDATPTYTWAATAIPAGATAPTFSANGTAAARATTATFSQAGAYTFTATVTDPTTGASATSSVGVTVAQTVKGLTVTPAGPVSLADGHAQQFAAAAVDQFGRAFTSAPAVTWSVATGVGSVSSTGLYQAPATGTGSATVGAAAGGYTSTAAVTVTLPAWLGAGSVATWNATTDVLTVTGATSIVADPGPDQPVIKAAGPAAVVTINPAAALVVHLGGLSLTGGASAVVTSLGTARTATNHRVLVLGLAGTTAAPPLAVDSASTLDLTDNDLVDHGGNLATINGLLRAGFAAGTGYWNGAGIGSSVAAAGTLFALGEAQPAAAGTFDGEAVGPADVEVRYTYYGDANLDGVVNAADYLRVDVGFFNRLTGWQNGDFNYDCVVDGSDYTMIDNAFNVQGAALATAMATSTAAPMVETAAPVAAVPAASGGTAAPHAPAAARPATPPPPGPFAAPPAATDRPASAARGTGRVMTAAVVPTRRTAPGRRATVPAIATPVFSSTAGGTVNRHADEGVDVLVTEPDWSIHRSPVFQG